MRKERKKLEKELDKLWSKAVLARDPICFYPNCSKPSTNPHHIHSRRYRGTRWDIENGVGLCSAHHTYSAGSVHQDPYKFQQLYIAKYNQTQWDKLYWKAHATTKWSEGDLLLMIKYLTIKIEEFI